jgi:hypothetical protein
VRWRCTVPGHPLCSFLGSPDTAPERQLGQRQRASSQGALNKMKTTQIHGMTWSYIHMCISLVLGPQTPGCFAVLLNSPCREPPKTPNPKATKNPDRRSQVAFYSVFLVHLQVARTPKLVHLHLDSPSFLVAVLRYLLAASCKLLELERC